MTARDRSVDRYLGMTERYGSVDRYLGMTARDRWVFV